MNSINNLTPLLKEIKKLFVSLNKDGIPIIYKNALFILVDFPNKTKIYLNACDDLNEFKTFTNNKFKKNYVDINELNRKQLTYIYIKLKEKDNDK